MSYIGRKKKLEKQNYRVVYVCKDGVQLRYATVSATSAKDAFNIAPIEHDDCRQVISAVSETSFS